MYTIFRYRKGGGRNTVPAADVMRIIVVGLGLIGGSICKAIKEFTEYHVIGVDADDTALDLAISMEAIDEVIPMHRLDLLDRGDLVFVCIPPGEAVKFLLENANNFKRGAIVTDVCGVKNYVVSNVEETMRAAGVEFIGSHPMAGTEYSGFTFSKSNLFVNASYLVTPTEHTDRAKLEVLKNFAKEIGFRSVLETSPERHDESIAYTSQLGHVVSNCYIRSKTLSKEKGFSAGTFLDMTRVARLDETIWSELFLLNKDNLLNEIEMLMEHLQEHKDALLAEDRDKIKSMLRRGKMLKQQNVQEKRTIHE